MDYKLLGKRIRAERKSKKMTQEQLAELIDCSPTHISHLENGSTKMSLSVFVSIVNALGVSADKLLIDSVYQSKAILNDELELVFADAEPDAYYVMLQAADTVKRAMTTRKRL